MRGEPDWLTDNRRNWDERVAIHLASDVYDQSDLRAGRGRLYPIEEAELGDLTGQTCLHLQCHFGADTLRLLQRGARAVVGLDFSAPAIAAARALADELGLADRARFVVAEVDEAQAALPQEAGTFDLVFVTWGAICWLPDLRPWAATVAPFLASGGSLYLAEGHPAALVFDDAVAEPDGRPGWFAPYLERSWITEETRQDYADPDAKLTHGRNHSRIHPLADVVNALIAAGLRLEVLNEHDAVPWAMFRSLAQGSDGLWRFPDRPWFPLSFSLRARKA